MDHRDIEERLSTLEQHAVLREELRGEIKRAAHELRDDSDFAGPYWRRGADTAVDHLGTKVAKKIGMYIVGAIAAALLIWLGSLGVLFK
jgi:type VI protein secretion system component VasF